MICKWKGDIQTGEILCGKDTASITTDNRCITCVDCLKMFKAKDSSIRNIHLNSNFLSYSSLDENEILQFEKFEDEKFHTTCREEAHRFIPKEIVTNDPRVVSCRTCLKAFWGDKENKKYTLQGVMIEAGHEMRFVRLKLKDFTTEQLTKTLDKYLYGDKV